MKQQNKEYFTLDDCDELILLLSSRQLMYKIHLHDTSMGQIFSFQPLNTEGYMTEEKVRVEVTEKYFQPYPVEVVWLSKDYLNFVIQKKESAHK